MNDRPVYVEEIEIIFDYVAESRDFYDAFLLVITCSGRERESFGTLEWCDLKSVFLLLLLLVLGSEFGELF